MKKAIVLFTLILVLFGLVACVGGNNEESHEHSFADSWSIDAVYHWHDATCEHTDEVSNKEKHNYVENVCSVCGYENKSEEVNPPEETPGDEEPEAELFIFQLVNDTHYEVSGVNDKTLKTLDIPSSYNNLPVTEISTGAFQEMHELETVIIPETIEKIGEFVFYQCEKIATVYFNAKSCVDIAGEVGENQFALAGSDKGIRLIFGAAVERIPSGLFHVYNMTNLKWVEFAENSVCNSIGSAAFLDSSVQEVSLPKSLKTIGRDAFLGCEALTKFSYEGGASDWVTITSDFGESSPIYYAKEVNMNGVSFTEADISATVTTIPEKVFENSSTLESVRIPESVTKIGNKAFFNCAKLKNVYYGAASIEEPIYANYIFRCEKSTEGIILTIGLAVQEIPAKTFYESSVKEIIFEGEGETSCKKIGENAFYSCGMLEKVEIAYGVEEIAQSAFHACPAIKEMLFDAQISDDEVFITPFENLSSANCSLKIGESVTSIPSYLFYGFKNVTTLVFLGESKLTIGNQSFMNCTRLKTVTFNDRVTKFGQEAFRECVSLEAVTIGKSVAVLDNSVFSGCTSIARVTYLSEVCNGNNANAPFSTTEATALGFDLTVGKGVKEIPAYCFSDSAVKTVAFEADSVCTNIREGAFASCDMLVHCELPQTITEIGSRAFSGAALTNVVIPDSVVTISESAFFYCESLTSVTIGSGVTSISRFAFADAHNLESVTFKDDSTWYRTLNVEDWANKTGGESVDLTNPTENVECISGNQTSQYYWYKK